MILGAPCERWSMDLTGEFPPSCGYRYIFTAICPFSKYAIAVAIKNKKAQTVAKVIVDKILLQWGIPFELLTDGGIEFCNSISQEIYNLLGIKKLKTTSREPRTNGVIETWHRVLNAMLAKVINDKQSDWPLWVNYVVWWVLQCL